jgi:hypothetical protein
MRNYTVLFSFCVYVATKGKPRSDVIGNYFFRIFFRIFIRMITKPTSFLTRVMREHYFISKLEKPLEIRRRRC